MITRLHNYITESTIENLRDKISKIVKHNMDLNVNKLLQVLHQRTWCMGLYSTCLMYGLPRTVEAFDIFFEEVGNVMQYKLGESSDVEFEWPEEAYNNMMEIKNILKEEAKKKEELEISEEFIEHLNINESIKGISLKNVYNNTMYWDNIILNDIIIGNVRRQTETRSLDLNKAGRQKTTTYYSISWDSQKIKELFGYNANNYRIKKDDCINAFNWSGKIPPTAKKIENYLNAELTRLSAEK